MADMNRSQGSTHNVGASADQSGFNAYSTAELLQILANTMNDAIEHTRKMLVVNEVVPNKKEFSEKQTTLRPRMDPAVGSSKSIRKQELASEMKASGPNEMTKWLGITDGDDLNKVFANSTIRLHYKRASDVHVTEAQKKEILKILRKGLDSCSGNVAEVGSSNSIDKMAIEVEVAGFDMRKLLGVTDDFNEVVAKSNAKSAGFEFRIRKSGRKNVEKAQTSVKNELLQEMANVKSDVQSSAAERANVQNDVETSIQEPQEEGLASQSFGSMDFEEVHLGKSDPLESDDDDDKMSSLFVEVGGSRSFSPRNLQDFDDDNAWELETADENSNSNLNLDKDINSSIQNVETQTESNHLKDAETQTDDSELSLTSVLHTPIKRKSQIDQYFQYFQVPKKVKMDEKTEMSQ